MFQKADSIFKKLVMKTQRTLPQKSDNWRGQEVNKASVEFFSETSQKSNPQFFLTLTPVLRTTIAVGRKMSRLYLADQKFFVKKFYERNIILSV